ncbi:LLM class flavin-dependent oxidoreductase [Microbacterium stercoris]|uniref:LLM class flavin-dependent oxidoreductase n=1 Tax=Microbacterium stercoris TaxID=2820289 RepID=A0A939QHY7_9MICO|nr:LLM class flavin-dependent oxidoreductase [Microbacterium stercoris]MBO3663009.1 LLM class flavin-dependent oxidoreductase [Microbacterium stercoris]
MPDYGQSLSFGSFVTPTNADPHRPVALAQASEAAGLDLVTFQDHPYQPSFHDTWTLLTWVAASTSSITVSGNVLNLPLRQPAVLARSAASLDLLSDGRFAMGLGAGGFWDAIGAMGGRKLTPGQGVTALGEAIEIMRGIWDAGNRMPLRHDGEYYRVSGAKRGPKPAHDIPIWLGAYKPRMLKLTGRTADGWLPSLAYLQPGDLQRGNATIDEAALAAGREPSEIRRLLNIAPVADTARWIDQLTAFALEDGMSAFILASDDESMLHVFGEEIAPAVREAVARERAGRGTVAAEARRGAIALSLRRDGIDYDAIPPSLAASAVEPGDRGHADLRHNYLRSGDPGLVLLPSTPAEVADALGYARAQDVPLGVRSGGHGVSGRSTNDGGVVIDLRRFRAIEPLDGAKVRIGVGATWGEVAAALAPRGLAISSGDYGGVGVGGLATTGGIGLLGRKYGLTIDHVTAADLVTADGRILRASAEENADLFWGLRGAGGNLGVVTAVEIDAMRLGNVVYSQMAFDATDTVGMLERWGAAVEASPRELTSFLILPPIRGGQQPVAQLMTVFAGDDTDEAIRALERLADAAPLLDHKAYLLPYSGVVQPADRHHQGGGDPVSRTGLVDHLDVATASAFSNLARSGAAHFLQVRATGGAAHDLAPDATAYPHRHQNFLLTALGASHERLDPIWDAVVAPHTNGLYLSFDTDQRPERLVDAFGVNLPRLREVKATWDPDNVFSANFPIR